MEASFNSSLSGISTYITRQNVTANDVANINTPGFEQQRVWQTEQTPYGVRISSISTVPNDSVELSNTDFAEEAGEMITNKNGTAANVKALKVKDRMTAEILDLFA
jgi:flagellar basal body rod protein FlgG